ncbi:MAG: hypothetical protein FWE69_07290 [Clostridiales bacterium]|nr:hypothetical protein [Clostridiales bacterium]
METTFASIRQSLTEADRLKDFAKWEKKAERTLARYLRFLENCRCAWAPREANDRLAPRYEAVCKDLLYWGALYRRVFLEGDFAAKAAFYKTHKEEVEELEYILYQCG